LAALGALEQVRGALEQALGALGQALGVLAQVLGASGPLHQALLFRSAALGALEQALGALEQARGGALGLAALGQLPLALLRLLASAPQQQVPLHLAPRTLSEPPVGSGRSPSS
jgi:hypothetical protein